MVGFGQQVAEEENEVEGFEEEYEDIKGEEEGEEAVVEEEEVEEEGIEDEEEEEDGVEEVKQSSPAQCPVQEQGVQVAVGTSEVVVLVLVFVVVVLVVKVVPDSPPAILLTILSPKVARLASNSTAFWAFHFAPLAPGTASAPVNARYRTSVSSCPLLPFTMLP